jgi:hypothetical protein
MPEGRIYRFEETTLIERGRKYGVLVTVLWLCLAAGQARPASKERDLPTPGLVTEFSASYNDALQVLQEIVQNQTIHGTYMFDRDTTLTGAVTAESTPLFERWEGGGKVFYKIRTEVIAPRHFRESADLGTVAVRYVLTNAGPERTRLRIDAIFVERARRVAHASDGTVESSEYKLIKERLDAMQFAEQEAAEAQRRRESQDLAKQVLLRQRDDERARLAAAESSAKDLEERVNGLRHQLVRRVKAPGARLKAAPFQSAASMADLAAYSDVVIVIVTPHWYGIETSTGQRGWVSVDQLELLP